MIIGERAAQAVVDMAKKNKRTISKECCRLGIADKTLSDWRHKYDPSNTIFSRWYCLGTMLSGF